MPNPTQWPRPADPAAAVRLRERFAALGPAQAGFARTHGPLLDAAGGNSPFLSDLLVREHRTLRLTVRAGPDAVLRRILGRLRAIPPSAPRARTATVLRDAKRQAALVAAMADLGGCWPLDAVTAALSALADAAVGAAVRHLLRAAHDAGELRLSDPDQPDRDSGLIVLGMGKLGAHELNYSSDIDLILFYDPAAHPYHGDGLGACFTRLARGLVSLLETRDAGGYVFRTDLRLRPDPGATPPCMALPAALIYYESMGQNWERAAMIKARPVAGDIPRGHAFLADIRPFVWRRYLDFAAIADIGDTKRRMDALRPDPGLPGRNLKLGPGGIREVEFTVQTLQLVWGGRDPALRAPGTLAALAALTAAGHMPPDAAAELAAGYRVLRRAEHRLQMVADRQTHALPDTAAGLDRFAVFLDDPGLADLQRHMETVSRRYRELFASVAPGPGLPGLHATRPDDPPTEAAAALAAMGFGGAAAIADTLRGWRTGRLRALRSDRARELLDCLLLPLLEALARQPDPDHAFAGFDALLTRLPGGVQLLSTFNRNPALIERVAAVMGAAPSLAGHLAAHPAALEGLLTPARGEDPVRLLARRLPDARDLEDTVAITGRTVRGAEFRLCVAQMEGWIDVDAAGTERTALADAAMAALLPPVLAEHAARHGPLDEGGLAVVAMGKAGGREMMAGSDLDLMFVYDHPPDAQSGGPRAMAAQQWFIRAAHAFVAALTSPGAEGKLFEVDMRLRPSGNKGPVALSLAAFERYHAESAWTWERMALTRGRVVAGPGALRIRVEAAMEAAMARAGDAAAIRADAAAMRGRMLRDLPAHGPWDVKLRQGGQIEVEFIAQTNLLAAGLRAQTTRVALRRLADAGVLPEADAAALVAADRLWRTVQSLLRIVTGRQVDTPTDAARRLLQERLPGASGLDLAGLSAMFDATAADVRRLFVRHVGEPK